MTSNNQLDADIDAMIRLQFAGLESVGRHPYKVWEAGFVRRWHLQPVPDTGLVGAYATNRGMRLDDINCVEALQVFHVHSFSIEPHQFDLYHAMEKDYDSVPGQQVEQYDATDKRRMDEEYGRYDPSLTEGRARGRMQVDMGEHRAEQDRKDNSAKTRRPLK